jgi:hypothetical protein
VLPLRYFHKNRAALLQSSIRKKSSYYSPSDVGLGYGFLFHFKELTARLAIGWAVGYCVSSYVYGAKPVAISAEEEEILEDETTL